MTLEGQVFVVRKKWRWVAVPAIAAASVLLSSCSWLSASGSGSGTGANPSASGNEPVKVGLLLPENQTVRYEKFDRPIFEKTLKEKCPNCQLEYANAQNDATKQQSQAESMLAQGVKVLALFPVDGEAAATIVTNAKSRGATVIGYGRTPNGPLDYTVSYSDEELGKANGTALKTALEAKGVTSGQLVWLDGDKATPNTAGIRQGGIDAIGSSYTIGREYYIKNWDPAEAQKAMDQAITALGKNNIVGVWSMNDGMAGGAVASMKNAGISPIPPLTGMDADISAVQRLLTGEQIASVYNSPTDIATTAGETAATVAQGQKPTTTGTLKNGSGNEIPLVAPPPPTVVTVDTIKKILIDTGVYKVDEICTAQYKTACAKAGLTSS